VNDDKTFIANQTYHYREQLRMTILANVEYYFLIRAIDKQSAIGSWENDEPIQVKKNTQPFNVKIEAKFPPGKIKLASITKQLNLNLKKWKIEIAYENSTLYIESLAVHPSTKKFSEQIRGTLYNAKATNVDVIHVYDDGSKNHEWYNNKYVLIILPIGCLIILIGIRYSRRRFSKKWNQMFQGRTLKNGLFSQLNNQLEEIELGTFSDNNDNNDDNDERHKSYNEKNVINNYLSASKNKVVNSIKNSISMITHAKDRIIHRSHNVKDSDDEKSEIAKNNNNNIDIIQIQNDNICSDSATNDENDNDNNKKNKKHFSSKK